MPTTYLDTPIAYTPCPEQFRELFRQANSRTVRIAILGDSQETSYGGQGGTYTNHLNAFFARHYGNSPETMLSIGGNFGGFGGGASNGRTTQGKWGIAGRNSISGGAVAFAASESLPETFSTSVNSNANYQGGYLANLLHDGRSHTDHLLRNSAYFDTSAGIKLRLYAMTRSGSVNLTIGNAYQSDHSHSFTLSDFQTNINFGQNNAALSVVTTESNVMTAPTTGQYLKTGTKLSSVGTSVDLIGMRFKMVANPAGVICDSWGLGGATATSWYTAYSGATKQLVGFGPYDCVFIQFAANDATSYDKATWKGHTQTLIGWVRAAHNNPYLPVVIITDGERVHADAPTRARYQSYPIGAWELANELTNVMAINLQRLCVQAGWTEADDSLSGLTDKGTWSGASVAYALNDFVTCDEYAGDTNGWSYTHWKCVAAHTSSATDGPLNSQYWVPLRRWMFDSVHLKENACRWEANAIGQAILNATYNNTTNTRLWRGS